ncbi:hypothetical protein V2O64_15280 [Verrucomicrobiaceae bacterium 227]
MKPKLLISVFCALIAGSNSLSGATVVQLIDAFDGDDSSKIMTTVGVESFLSQSVNALGGSRNSVMTVSENTFPTTTRTRINRNGSGLLSVSFGPSATGTVETIYRGSDGNGLGGFDLLAGNADSFGIDILFLDNPINVLIHLTDTDGNQSKSEIMLSETITSPEPHLFLFSSFSKVT